MRPRNNTSPAQQWDALVSISGRTLVLPDTASSTLSISTQLHHHPAAPHCKASPRRGTPWPWPEELLHILVTFFLKSHLFLLLLLYFFFFLKRACHCWWHLPNTVGARTNLAHRKERNLTKSLIRNNTYKDERFKDQTHAYASAPLPWAFIKWGIHLKAWSATRKAVKVWRQY